MNYKQLFPKTWDEAQKLTANEFAKSALTELKKWGEKGTYAELAKLIYRSESAVMTWCAPNSENPLPVDVRHHIWLAVTEYARAKPKHRRSWSGDDDELLRKYHPTMTTAEIALLLGRSHSAIATRLGELGLKKIKPLTEAELNHLKNATLTNREVAELTGRSIQAVYNYRKTLNVTGYPKHTRGRPKKA
jgi:transcriptional regulator of aromatic amino acid metabolism